MRHELRNARRLLAALCAAVALACAGPARGQEEGREPRARKTDEYANLFSSCNAGAHLDNFAIELQNDTTLTGHILLYGPSGPKDGYGERAAGATKNYLVNSRGIEESRLRVTYVGRYKKMDELLTELWLVPEGAAPPPRTRYKPDFGFEGKLYERGLWDDPPLGLAEGESWSNSSEVAFIGLSEIMRRRKEALAYLVVYHGKESAPGAWRRASEQQVEKLRGYGIPAERVKVIFAGYAEEDSLQVWVLPPDAPPPAKRRRERRPERSAQVADLDEMTLKYNVDWAYKSLVDVLKADPQLTACLVVRPGPAEPEDVDPEEAPDPDEPPDVDVMQLAEKWRAEFRKSGIGEHRLIVMVVPTGENQWSASLETWVVPPGAPLPDPSADGAAGAEAEAAENP